MKNPLFFAIKEAKKIENKNCKNIINGIPAINFMCLVLCRIIIIVISIAKEPPKAEIHNSVSSEIRLFPFPAINLSYTVNQIAINEINARYISEIFNIITSYIII